MMRLGVNLHPVPTAMLIVAMISIRTHSARHTVSIGNRFPWLYIVFSISDSGVSS